MPSPSFVQGHSYNSGPSSVSVSSFSGAFLSGNTSGNTIIVFLAVDPAGGGAFNSFSVSDSHGNQYIQAALMSAAGGNAYAAFIASVVSAGSNTVTVTAGGA